MGKTATLSKTVSAGGPLVDGGANFRDTAITTSGAATYSFTAVPSWARKIRLMFRNVSVNAAASTAAIQVQLGTSGGLVTTGYANTLHTLDTGTLSTSTLNTAFLVSITGADAYIFSGTMDFCEIDANNWVQTSQVKATTSRSHIGAGDVPLGARLTTITVFVGVGAFDGGTINVIYE